MSERKRKGRWGRVYFLIPWEFRGYVFQRFARPLIFGLIILWIRLQAHHCFLSNSCELTWNDRHTPTRSGYRQRVPPLTTVFFTNFKIIIKKSDIPAHAITPQQPHFFIFFSPISLGGVGTGGVCRRSRRRKWDSRGEMGVREGPGRGVRGPIRRDVNKSTMHKMFCNSGLLARVIAETHGGLAVNFAS